MSNRRIDQRQRNIIYSPPMVLANLAGAKTQTRRIIENCRTLNRQDSEFVGFTDGFLAHFRRKGGLIFFAGYNCPYGKIGDILYGRERLYLNTETNEWHYFADKKPIIVSETDALEAVSWAHHKEQSYCPSIHMPKFAARIWQEIVGIRVERLQDITEADAIAEGCIMGADGFPVEQPHRSGVGTVGWDDAKQWYAWQWEEINGEDSWDINPFVWVVEYKQIAKPQTT